MKKATLNSYDDYVYLVTRGWSDAGILARWNEEAAQENLRTTIADHFKV